MSAGAAVAAPHFMKNIILKNKFNLFRIPLLLVAAGLLQVSLGGDHFSSAMPFITPESDLESYTSDSLADEKANEVDAENSENAEDASLDFLPHQTWTRVRQRSTCEGDEPERCKGYYGFSVMPNGQYTEGPSPSGNVITGYVTQVERTKLSNAVNLVIFKNVNRVPVCEPSFSIPGVTNLFTLKLPGRNPIPIYRQTATTTCIQGDIMAVKSLIAIQHALTNKYYRVPFPSGFVRRGLWGGVGLTLNTMGPNSLLQFDCAHGVILGRLIVNARGRFYRWGTIVFEGGPEPIGGRPTHPAYYVGQLLGDTLLLTASYQRGNRTIVQTFTLKFGVAGELHRCL